MAAEFLRSHGLDIDAEMARIQNEVPAAVSSAGTSLKAPSISHISKVSLPRKPPGTLWDVSIADSCVSSIIQHEPAQTRPASDQSAVQGNGALLAPSLCHPHVHIDKAYLLSHPKYSHLRIESGDFKEAMSLTGQAKADFAEDDLLERGQRLIDESAEAGVTHMRAFVEVDVAVGTKCLEAGIKLKRIAEQEGKCFIQLCAFAQLPLFSDASAAGQEDQDASTIRRLMVFAAAKPEIDVVGSTPYVEQDLDSMKRNVDWMIKLSIEHGKHLDFHLDYNLDNNEQPLVWYVIDELKKAKWLLRAPTSTVVLGHCTRLSLFKSEDWRKLQRELGDLPLSFVGLPTSDLFMMRTPDKVRGTLDVPVLIKDHGLNACVGINNIGNAFTPQGSCDPMTLACNGVGVYQAGTEQDAELLYECVSTRARKAIGLSDRGTNLDLKEGDPADLLLFVNERSQWRTRRSVSEAVYLYDNCKGRRAFLEGRQVAG